MDSATLEGSTGPDLPLKPLVTVDRVWKKFGESVILRDVSMQVRPGEVACVIGPSGGGKSTMLRCINHLEEIDAGEIRIDGLLVGYREKGGKLYEIPERDACDARSNIGMVFQHFNLFPHLTAAQNVMLGPVRVRKIAPAVARVEACQLLERVGLGSKLDSFPRQLSGGQQQRVAIARALAMHPRVMLFDEPTSALDPEVVGEVLSVISNLASDGMTMIIVTHEMSFAKNVCDYLYFMDAGRIVEHSSPVQFFENPQSDRAKEFLRLVRAN